VASAFKEVSKTETEFFYCLGDEQTPGMNSMTDFNTSLLSSKEKTSDQHRRWACLIGKNEAVFTPSTIGLRSTFREQGLIIGTFHHSSTHLLIHSNCRVIGVKKGIHFETPFTLISRSEHATKIIDSRVMEELKSLPGNKFEINLFLFECLSFILCPHGFDPLLLFRFPIRLSLTPREKTARRKRKERL